MPKPFPRSSAAAWSRSHANARPHFLDREIGVSEATLHNWLRKNEVLRRAVAYLSQGIHPI